MLLPAEGQEFGKYLLLDRVAVGGMSEIYRARMTAAAGVTKQVVIKKILPRYAGNDAFVSMFINEARIAAGLSHGNISQVIDFGEVDGEYYLALEWVHGQPLSKVVRRAREKGLATLPVPLALRIATEMLRGLAYAHNRLDESGRPLNIIHRDVSPQNVLVGYEGQVKLVDFGIARARMASRIEPEETAAQGKYMYFAPEQARGRELDARADIFAAGVVLYEMLCGRLPWEGEQMEVLKRIVLSDFPPPRSLNPAIPPELERILLTALAVERERRYPSAEGFGEVLETYLHTVAPDFPASALAHFMGYLFESELVAEGRPVRLPPDFLGQLELWSKGLPADVVWPRTPSRSMPALPPPPEPPRKRSGLAAWVLLGAPVLAALLAAVLLFTGESTQTFSVELTSTPQGASVWVDGQLLMNHTPTLISLSADREHLIEVHAIGMESWSQRVRAEEGATLAVRAQLRPARTRAPASAPPGSSSLAPAAQIPNEGRFPLPGFEVRPAQHSFLVPRSSAARLRLDPSRTYSLRTEGAVVQGPIAPASAAKASSIDAVVYYLEGGPGLSARESFGLLGPEERRVTNAFALYLFVPEPSGRDTTGGLRVHVRETLSGTGATVMVDARHHALTPRPEESFTLHGLDAATTYEVRLRDTARPARTRGIQGEAVGRVLVLQDGGCGATEGEPWKPGPARVVETGRPTRIAGASRLRFTFPDEDLEDNAGALAVEVKPVAGARPPGC